MAGMVHMMVINEFPQVVTIAGNDSDGSAGGPADLHTFFTRNTYGMMILTAAVAGNSHGITAAHQMPTEFIDAQFKAIADDFAIRAAKTGMLGTVEVIENVVANLKAVDFGYLVVDPVISTKHGNTLLEPDAVTTMKDKLLPLADVITPNFYEAQILADMTIGSSADQIEAARQLQRLGVKNIVIKGPHDNFGAEALVRDFVLLEDGESFWLEAPYIATDRINGTGDTFAAVIVSELALGRTVKQAIEIAKFATHRAIAKEIAVGHQYGPINHWQLLTDME